MKKGVVVGGIVVIALFLFLFLSFPQIFYPSAGEINSSDYRQGEKVTVYGKITDKNYINLENLGIGINLTIIQLDNKLNVSCDGEVKHFGVGDYVVMEIVKNEKKIEVGPFKFIITYWESSEGSIHMVDEYRFYFEIGMAAGIVIALVGVAMRY